MTAPESVDGRAGPSNGPSSPTSTMIEVEDLSCSIEGAEGRGWLLRDINFSLETGRTLGIVGESGSGKSMLVRAALGLAPRAAAVSGCVRLAGRDTTAMSKREHRQFVGRNVGVVFQNPMTSLNPVVRIGRQVSEASRKHLGLSRREARRKAVELLESVGVSDAKRRIDDFPHQFSGGMRQRVMIAMALACEPQILIADEATTALDVTVQREILDLLQRIQRERNMTMVLVSHDMNIVAGRTDDVAVMYGGRLVEKIPTKALSGSHQHRYTEALLSAVPRLDQVPHRRLPTIPGRPPTPDQALEGCPFAPRCGAAIELCETTMPERSWGAEPGHFYHCHVPVHDDAKANVEGSSG